MDDFKKVKRGSKKVADGKDASANRKTENNDGDDDYTTMTEKIKAKEKALEERKKKSMKAWGKTDMERTYGASYSVRFAIKKLW